MNKYYRSETLITMKIKRKSQQIIMELNAIYLLFLNTHQASNSSYTVIYPPPNYMVIIAVLVLYVRKIAAPREDLLRTTVHRARGVWPLTRRVWVKACTSCPVQPLPSDWESSSQPTSHPLPLISLRPCSPSPLPHSHPNTSIEKWPCLESNHLPWNDPEPVWFHG